MSATPASRCSPVLTRRSALKRLVQAMLGGIGAAVCGGFVHSALWPPASDMRFRSRLRRRIRAGPVQFPGAGATLPGYLARPSDPGPARVLLFADPGLAQRARNVALDYAQKGLVVLVVDLHARYSSTALFPTTAAARRAQQNAVSPAQAAADIQAAFQYLISCHAVQAGSIRLEYLWG